VVVAELILLVRDVSDVVVDVVGISKRFVTLDVRVCQPWFGRPVSIT